MLLVVAIIGVHGNDEQPHCIWRGVCYRNPPNDDVSEDLYNCPYYGPPLPLKNEKLQQVMMKYCPDIYKDRKRPHSSGDASAQFNCANSLMAVRFCIACSIRPGLLQ